MSRTQTQALSYLDGMAEIVRAERLVRGDYVTQPTNGEVGFIDAEATCEGRRFCAIGSLWTGAGIKPVWRKAPYGIHLEMPGAWEGKRREFLSHRHGLRVAYDALNEAAEEYIATHQPVGLDTEYKAAIEALFEGVKDIGRTELLEIIARAKGIVAGQVFVTPGQRALVVQTERDWELA